MAAIPRLLSGSSVTQTALELGYDSPAAFSSMFRKVLGQSPSAFVRAASRPPEEGGGSGLVCCRKFMQQMGK